MLSEERNFWESKIPTQPDGSFETLSDSSYKKIIAHFNPPADSFGLEYACGSGAFSNFIADCQIVGLDISMSLLKNSESIIPVQANGEKLPFVNESFDFVICAAALHHIPQLNQAISEIYRVIKHGGYIYIFELNTNHPQRKLVAARESKFRKVFKTTSFSPAESLIPEKKLLRILDNAGFALNSKSYISPVYRNPTALAKLQAIVSRYFAKGILKKYVEGYLLISARKL